MIVTSVGSCMCAGAILGVEGSDVAGLDAIGVGGSTPKRKAAGDSTAVANDCTVLALDSARLSRAGLNDEGGTAAGVDPGASAALSRGISGSGEVGEAISLLPSSAFSSVLAGTGASGASVFVTGAVDSAGSSGLGSELVVLSGECPCGCGGGVEGLACSCSPDDSLERPV